VSVDEYSQVRQDIRDLRMYIETQFTKFVPYPEYNARHTEIEKDIAGLAGELHNHIEESKTFYLQQQKNKSLAFWNILGYVVVMVSSGTFVYAVEWLLRR
jgi:hypothetical protein